MATEKPRFSVTFSDDSYNRIRQYQKDNKISTQSKAVAQLVAIAINEMEKNGEIKKASLYSNEALGLARDYDGKLDNWGRKQVRTVADNEMARCAAELRGKRGQRPSAPPPPAGEGVRYIIPEYFGRVSAGSGQPAADERPENAHLTRQPPPGASYIAYISGDSMEPTYHDGDRVFVSAIMNIFPGEIGVFLQGGEQYIKELGDGVLISHNAKYPPIPLQDDIRCQGVVLGVCDDSYFEQPAGELV